MSDDDEEHEEEEKDGKGLRGTLRSLSLARQRG